MKILILLFAGCIIIVIAWLIANILALILYLKEYDPLSNDVNTLISNEDDEFSIENISDENLQQYVNINKLLSINENEES